MIAKIIGIRNEAPNIIIEVEYTLPDKRIVVNPYFAQVSNFVGLDQAGINKFIQSQIEYQCERYLEAFYSKEAETAKAQIEAIRDQFSYETKSQYYSSILSSLIGQSFAKDSFSYNVLSNGEVFTDQYCNPEGKVAVQKITVQEKLEAVK